MQRAILLQTTATKTKQNALKEFSREAIELANDLLKQRKSKHLMDLHRATYSASKKKTSFGSQVICDIERNVARSKATAIRQITVKFNAPRNCKVFETKANFFVEFRMYPKKVLAVPIKRNRCFQRYCSLVESG
ncbi:MAG: hypothetical protein AB1467_01730 [Candidatus Diapherotrites archaeon]